MAGDWIKVEITLPDKPEIVHMAELLKLDQDAVTGKCLRFWIWLNQNSPNGHALSVTPSFVDRLCACPGFGKALERVGWCRFGEGVMEVPHFDRHNSQSAKERSLAVARKHTQRERERREGHAGVTEESRLKRDRSVTRVESIEVQGGGHAHARPGARDSMRHAGQGKKDTTTTTNSEGASSEEEIEVGTLKAVVEAWNELCPDLQPSRLRTAARDRLIARFWDWCGRDIEQVRRLFVIVSRSNLLNGRPHRTKTDRKPYKTRFDWVINPENAARIAEGVFSDEPEA